MSTKSQSADKTNSTCAVMAAVTLFMVVLAAVVVGEMTVKALLFTGGLMFVLIVVKGFIENNPWTNS